MAIQTITNTEDIEIVILSLAPAKDQQGNRRTYGKGNQWTEMTYVIPGHEDEPKDSVLWLQYEVAAALLPVGEATTLRLSSEVTRKESFSYPEIS